jgi:hypothetical protein
MICIRRGGDLSPLQTGDVRPTSHPCFSSSSSHHRGCPILRFLPAKGGRTGKISIALFNVAEKTFLTRLPIITVLWRTLLNWKGSVREYAEQHPYNHHHAPIPRRRLRAGFFPSKARRNCAAASRPNQINKLTVEIRTVPTVQGLCKAVRSCAEAMQPLSCNPLTAPQPSL